MRFIWWMVYATKMNFFVLVAILFCALIKVLFKKGDLLLYIAGGAIAFVAGIFYGIRTFHNIDFAHPVLAVIGVITANVLMDIFYLTLFSFFQDDTKEKNVNEEEGQESIIETERDIYDKKEAEE